MFSVTIRLEYRADFSHHLLCLVRLWMVYCRMLGYDAFPAKSLSPPVSYTHLDVYKRQHLPFSSCLRFLLSPLVSRLSFASWIFTFLSMVCSSGGYSKICSNILGGRVPFISSYGVNPVESWVVLFNHSSTFFTYKGHSVCLADVYKRQSQISST